LRRPGHALWILAACALLPPAAARAETFVFQGHDEPDLEGKVLAEFEDLLFVAVDGEGTRFLARAELEAIVDDDGRRHEAPRPGAFAPLGSLAPAGAVTDIVGQAWASDLPQPILAGPLFLRAGQGITTSEEGLARLVLPSGAECKLAATTQVTLLSDQARESVKLLEGELFLSSRLRPVQVTLLGSAIGLVESDSRVTCRRLESTLHVRQYSGQCVVTWPELVLILSEGLGVEIVRLDEARWRLTADPANHASLEVKASGEAVELAPGESRVFGAGEEPEAELWRLLRASGELLLRRGEGARFAAVDPQLRDRLVLGPGDVLRTGAGALATLVRVDGATATLAAATTLAVDDVLHLDGGELTVESLESPVQLETPAGIARLRMSIVRLARRPGDHEDEAPGIEALTIAGLPQLPLGPTALLALEPRSSARIARESPAADDKTTARLTQTAGRGLVLSRESPLGPDPGFRVPVTAGDELAVVSDARQGEPAATLLLPARRELAFATGGVGATVPLRPDVSCELATGARLELKEGLRLALASVDGLPQLLFVDGPRLLLAAPFRLRVENPTVVLLLPDGKQSTLKLEGDIDARLAEGGPFSAASIGVRGEDRLELPPSATSSIEQDADLTRFELEGPRRRLWIEAGAPPVQARFADARRRLFLTMPGTAALGIEPNRQLTVLATTEGEFVILDEETLDRDRAGLELLAGQVGPQGDSIGRDRIPDLLDVPPPDSPSGP